MLKIILFQYSLRSDVWPESRGVDTVEFPLAEAETDDESDCFGRQATALPGKAHPVAQFRAGMFGVNIHQTDRSHHLLLAIWYNAKGKVGFPAAALLNIANKSLGVFEVVRVRDAHRPVFYPAILQALGNRFGIGDTQRPQDQAVS